MGKRNNRTTRPPKLTLAGHGPDALPSAESERPGCPAWIEPDAKAAWRFVAPRLAKMGLLHKLDRNALSRYCTAYARWKKAELFLQKHGEIYPLKDERGQVRYFLPWPQVAIAHKLGQTLARLEQEFGLTPSARTRIEPTARRPEADNDEGRLLLELVSRGGPAPPRKGFKRPTG
jgi:P27 family predicted phage terminase small subunit